MSTVGRLTFLYPQLARATRAACPREARRAPVAAGWARQKATFAPRHGKGVEPALPRDGDQPKPQQEKSPDRDQQAEKLEDVQPPAVREPDTEKRVVKTAESEEASSQTAPEQEAPRTAQPTAGNPDGLSPANDSKSTASSDPPNLTAEGSPSEAEAEEQRLKQKREQARHSGPLEAVLHMQPPEQVAKQHPSMSPSPYVHHFDSYSFVKQLQEGGYTREQAITAMKGIRGLLASNLDVAQESLVSKSDVENETYLFRAACSELSTEIRNNRRLHDEHTRQQRTHLQHEVDNLTQSLNQELLTLNDNVRGMFNDRKMAVREEQKSVESAVQQISYKISIMLSSDSKSEIEGVRWILIRRSVLGILFMAVLTLGTLRYATYVGHERQKETERQLREEDEMRRNGGKKDVTAADAAVILAAG